MSAALLGIRETANAADDRKSEEIHLILFAAVLEKGRQMAIHYPRDPGGNGKAIEARDR